MTRHLAFDLGAESGRAMRGDLDGDRLSLTEVARFANVPVRGADGSLRWDVEQFWTHMRGTLDGLDAPTGIASIGVDTWGCDYALLDAHGALIERPYHYRDTRTDGVMNRVLTRVSRERIYDITGIQLLPFNTIFQIYAALHDSPDAIGRAATLLTIPDLLNYWLTGRRGAEFTNATTTQLVDARTRTWAEPLLDAIGLDPHLLPELAQPGGIYGSLQHSVSESLTGTPVVLPACHDTGSAVASVATGGDVAFLSSGTWSLLGTELSRPLLTREARDLNFTNEGGVCGTTRLLKNIAGLWLLQRCLREWGTGSSQADYHALLDAAADAAPFRTLVDPDDPAFLHPDGMTSAIDRRAAVTGEPAPRTHPEYARSILESLALKYRVVLDSLETLTGSRINTIRVVGGGARNALLNQFTADATGCTVLSGPVEATALGNIAMQLLATEAVDSLAHAREIIQTSFPAVRFEPRQPDAWARQLTRFATLWS